MGCTCVFAEYPLPIISRPVEWKGQKYLDGGLADNIPLDKCLELGCYKIIIVLTRPLGYVRKENLATITRLCYPRYKNLQRTAEMRNENYNRRIEQILQLEREGKVFVLRPSEEISISRLEKDPARLEQVYNIGIKDATDQWATLQAYLEKV